MNTSQFWPDELFNDREIILYPPEQLTAFGISQNAVQFLSTIGLPQYSAPWLQFEIPRDGELKTVRKEWGIPEKEIMEWETSAKRWGLPGGLDKFISIGADGSGDPIAITEAGEGNLYILNHDNCFEPTLLNSSPHQLAACLIAYNRFRQNVVKENGADAMMQDNIPAHLQQWLDKELDSIDNRATQYGAFWQYV